MEKNLALWWNTFLFMALSMIFGGKALAEVMDYTVNIDMALAMTRFLWI
ncbi:hypothetical protein KAW11_01750 [Candidatus Bathyarchaeota archaeon]|nr:hypothetical protein [Candidatus Bathyarchaeota archaeon]